MTNETSPASTPRMRFREMMRADILSAAGDILTTGGYGALSMRTLAEAVGVRAPTLYDYFESKEDVLNALFLEAVGTIRQYFIDNVATTTPGVPRIISMGMTYRNFAIKNPALFLLVFSRLDSTYVPGPEQMEAGKGLFDALRVEVDNAIELGQLGPGDPEAITVTLWSNVHGLSVLELNGYMQKCVTVSTDDVAAFAMSAIFCGLIPRSDNDNAVISCPLSQPGPALVGE